MLRVTDLQSRLLWEEGGNRNISGPLFTTREMLCDVFSRIYLRCSNSRELNSHVRCKMRDKCDIKLGHVQKRDPGVFETLHYSLSTVYHGNLLELKPKLFQFYFHSFFFNCIWMCQGSYYTTHAIDSHDRKIIIRVSLTLILKRLKLMAKTSKVLINLLFGER